MRRKLLLLAILLPAAACAQMWDRLGQESLPIDTTKTKQLEIAIDAISFFRDNEYSTPIRDGYSLPGARVRPTLNYNPTENIHLELGASALFFDGANKYPNYAYHDIGQWKGNQYQDGAHLLPWLRAQIDLGGTQFVFGDIYGAQNHRFITPMYHDEQLLSADPEAGFQILHNSRNLWADLYLNWQSYQFEMDTHQEAFTVGGSFVFRPFTKQAPTLSFPVQFVVQHRGGEQDITHTGVQTLWNASAGIAWQQEETPRPLRLKLEANILACYQQTGHLWQYFNSGLAFHAAATAILKPAVSLEAGLFRAPKNFANLYGSPFFSTMSLKNDEVFNAMTTAYLNLDYSHTWASAYTLGANLETFVNKSGISSQNQTANHFSFSFGLYFRFSPRFAL